MGLKGRHGRGRGKDRPPTAPFGLERTPKVCLERGDFKGSRAHRRDGVHRRARTREGGEVRHALGQGTAPDFEAVATDCGVAAVLTTNQ